MNKNSTFIYLLNSEEGDKSEMIDLNDFGDNGFTDFEEVFKTLDTVKSSPSKFTINKIIQFARSYEVIDLGSKGIVEMILN